MLCSPWVGHDGRMHSVRKILRPARTLCRPTRLLQREGPVATPVLSSIRPEEADPTIRPPMTYSTGAIELDLTGRLEAHALLLQPEGGRHRADEMNKAGTVGLTQDR